MASNSFGTIFKITTWGESHGKAIGVVIDGCPAGIEITQEEIAAALELRTPGRNAYMTPRKEQDIPEIISGVFEGKTTGAPICISIANQDAISSSYENIHHLLRPGHANYTYLQKYGLFDYRGGGRASARETASRVAAGAVARKILNFYGINIVAYLKQVGSLAAVLESQSIESIRKFTLESPIFCPDPKISSKIISLIDSIKLEGDSLGGIVEFYAESVPCLGDPVYEKLEANLAHAMMSIPASKGFEIGSGFSCVVMKGSEHNDVFECVENQVKTKTNYAGGVLGGISTGMPIAGRVAFKPTSSIAKAQQTLTTSKETATFQLPEGSRHDPCVAIRAVPVVEAMLALVLVDALLLNKCAVL